MCVSVWAHNQDMRELAGAVKRSANSDETSVCSEEGEIDFFI